MSPKINEHLWTNDAQTLQNEAIDFLTEFETKYGRPKASQNGSEIAKKLSWKRVLKKQTRKSLKNDAQIHAKTRVGKSIEKVIKMVANGSQKKGKTESQSLKSWKVGCRNRYKISLLVEGY